VKVYGLFHVPTALFPGRLDGPQNRSGRREEEKNLLPPTWSRTAILRSFLAHRIVTIPSEL